MKTGMKKESVKVFVLCRIWARRPHLERLRSLLTFSVPPTWLTLSFTIHHSACQHSHMASTATVICNREQLGSLTWFARWGIYLNRLTGTVKCWCQYMAYTAHRICLFPVSFFSPITPSKFKLMWDFYFCFKCTISFFFISALMLTVFLFSILYCSPPLSFSPSLSLSLPLSSRP